MAEFRLNDLPILTADSVRESAVAQGWDTDKIVVSILPPYEGKDGVYQLPLLISPRSDLDLWDDENAPKMTVSYTPEYEEWGDLLTLSGYETWFNQIITLTEESN